MKARDAAASELMKLRRPILLTVVTTASVLSGALGALLLQAMMPAVGRFPVAPGLPDRRWQLNDPEYLASGAQFFVQQFSVVIAIVWVLSVTREDQFKTWRTVLMVNRSRKLVFEGKVVSLLAVSAAAAGITAIASAWILGGSGIEWSFGAVWSFMSDVLAITGAIVFVGAIGFLLGVVVRSGTSALGLLLGWFLIVEPAIMTWRGRWRGFLPGGFTADLARQNRPLWLGILVAGMVLLAGYSIFRVRDFD